MFCLFLLAGNRGFRGRAPLGVEGALAPHKGGGETLSRVSGECGYPNTLLAIILPYIHYTTKHLLCQGQYCNLRRDCPCPRGGASRHIGGHPAETKPQFCRRRQSPKKYKMATVILYFWGRSPFSYLRIRVRIKWRYHSRTSAIAGHYYSVFKKEICFDYYLNLWSSRITSANREIIRISKVAP